MTQSPAPLHAAIDMETLMMTATFYSKRLGYECFPLTGKTPALGYEWQQNALGQSGVHSASLVHWQAATGFAMAPVAGSKDVILDIDDPTFESQIKDVLPRVHNAFTVRRGDHCHIYLRLQSSLPKAYLTLRDDKQERASLRGAGAYVVGPRSLHPDGDVYTPINNAGPMELDVLETQNLLALFGEHMPINVTRKRKNPQASAPASEIGSQGIWERLGESIGDINYVGKALVESTMQALFQHGYRARWDGQRQVWWLNGQCPNHAAHKHADQHPSFGYNSRGVGYCFVCGPMLTTQVADLLGLERRLRRPAPARHRRSELIERKLTLSVRLVDLLHTLTTRLDKRGRALKNTRHFTIDELLQAGRRVGWSRACTYRNIRQGIQAGLLKRVRRGLYECSEQFDEPAPVKPFGKGYSEHPAEYRRGWLMKIEREMQPQHPTIYNPSAPSIAWRAGIRERTLYRYEKRLGIRRIQVWKRSTPPTIPGPDGLPVPYLPDQGQKCYQRLEVVNQEGTLRRIDFRRGHALDDAIKVAGTWGGIVLLSERKPSIRVLPGQDARDRVPSYGTLSWDERRFVIDPPQLPKLLKMVSPAPTSQNRGNSARLRVSAQQQSADALRAELNDTSLSVKVKTKGLHLDGERLDRQFCRGWIDLKARQTARQLRLFEIS
jgi:hypothetical protein